MTKNGSTIMDDRSTSSRTVSVLQECKGCGLVYVHNHHCLAADVRCTKCSVVGHYSGLCLQSSTQTQALTKFSDNVVFNTNTAPNLPIRNVTSSDSYDENFTEFLFDIKSACEIMPFCELSKKELLAIVPNNTCLKDELQFYKTRSSKLQKVVNDFARKLEEVVNEQILNLQTVDKELKKMLQDECGKRQMLQSFIKQNEKYHQNDIQVLEKEWNQRFSDKVKELEQTICDHATKLKAKEEEHRMEVQRVGKQWNEKVNSITTANQRLTNDLVEKLDAKEKEYGQIIRGLKQTLQMKTSEVEEKDILLSIYKKCDEQKSNTIRMLKDDIENKSNALRQRNELLKYTRRLENHVRVLQEHLDDITEDQAKMVNRHYKESRPESPRHWSGSCKICGGTRSHGKDDCLARRIECQLCDEVHCAAMCKSKSLVFTPTPSEAALLRDVGKDM